MLTCLRVPAPQGAACALTGCVSTIAPRWACTWHAGPWAKAQPLGPQPVASGQRPPDQPPPTLSIFILPQAYEKLCGKLRELNALEGISGLLVRGRMGGGWDAVLRQARALSGLCVRWSPGTPDATGFDYKPGRAGMRW